MSDFRFLNTIQKRLMILEALILFLCVCVECRLVYLQIFKHVEFREMAYHQQYTPIQTDASRGKIEAQDGSLMAMNIQLFNVGVNTTQITDKPKVAAILSGALGISYPSVLSKLAKNRQFVWLDRAVPYQYSEAIENLKIQGVDATREQHRLYPDREMAAQVLGFTGIDDQGLDGLERYYNSLLMGKNGLIMAERDARGRLVMAGDKSLKPGRDGLNIRTTLDETIQHIAQVELENAFVKFRCKAASIVVMDPATGAILAMANYPTFDPNHYSQYPEENWKNRVVNDQFEPGSTFKLVAAVGALDTGLVKEDDRFFCENGAYKTQYGRIVRDDKKWGTLTFQQILGYSSNIGMVKVAHVLGEENLYRYCKNFGFGAPTGIDLPGEATGELRPLDQWSGLSMTTIPYGYEVSATPIQIVDAYEAIANGGVMMKPYIVQDLEDSNGHVVKSFGPQKIRRVCSDETAQRMTKMLEWVVQHGTGTQVALPDYEIAGKTGTAYKFSHGHYDPNNYVASFVGFLPADHPKVLIYVSLDSPRGIYWGGYTAGPVVKEVAQRVMAYDLVPEKNEVQTAQAFKDERKVPSFAGLTPEECQWLAQASGLHLSFIGRGERVVAQSAAVGAPLMAGDQNPRELVLTLGKPQLSDAGGFMPKLLGKTKRQALALLAPLGVRVNFHGMGIVRAQFPPAGESVGSDVACELSCDEPLTSVTAKISGGKS